MTPAAAALEAARAAGVRVTLAGTDLRLEAAREPSPDLLAELREHKVVIVGLLAEAQAPLRTLAPPESGRPAPGTARRPRGAKTGWPDREDLEGWRIRLKAAPHQRARREVVLAWLALWGGRSDGYGRPVLPEDLPAREATAALRSACGHYWRAVGDRVLDPKPADRPIREPDFDRSPPADDAPVPEEPLPVAEEATPVPEAAEPPPRPEPATSEISVAAEIRVQRHDPGPLPRVEGGFGVVYADPPWSFGTCSEEGEGRSPEGQAHHRTMDLDAIRALPVAEVAARDAFCVLWTTGEQVENALGVLKAWGFEFETLAFAWVRTTTAGGLPGPIGPGRWTRPGAEVALLGTRGSPRRLREDVRQVILAARRGHGRKPEEAYRRTEALAGGPCLELFARRRRPGWHAWCDRLPEGPAEDPPPRLAPLPRVEGGYGTILADPPWRYENRTGKASPEHGRLWRYASLALEDIMDVPVAEAAAEVAHLYLWVPTPLLPFGFAVMEAWGFTYKTTITWRKTREDGGSDGRCCGHYYRVVTEHCLFGVRGSKARTLDPARRQTNLIEAADPDETPDPTEPTGLIESRKREHSRKPDELYPIIEACSWGPFLELFARRRRPGWHAWGDEVTTGPPEGGSA